MHPSSGFTLVELIVVLTLLVITLSFTFPQVSRVGFLESRNRTARWVIAEVSSLKARAAMEQQSYVLRVDTEGQTLTAMQAPGPEALKQVLSQAGATSPDGEEGEGKAPAATADRFEIPGDLSVVDVLFAGRDTVATGVVDITFHAKGYSDRAMIHLQDGDRRVSFIIEPFLSRVKVVEGYAAF